MHVMYGIGQIAIDFQSWSVTPGKVSPCFAIVIQAYVGAIFQWVVNVLSQPASAEHLHCSRTDPSLLALCRLQCGQDIGAKKAPVLLEAVKWRKQSCFVHGFEEAQGLSTCRGELVCPRGCEQHQLLQFKFAIDGFLRVILWQRTHSVARSPTFRKLVQSEEMCCGDKHVALPSTALDFAVLALDGPRFATGCCAGCSSARGWSRLTVDLLAKALHGTLQVIGRAAHTCEIAARKRSAHGFDLVPHLAAQALRDAVTNLLQRPFGLVRQAIGAVAQFDLLLASPILLRVQFGFAHHALDLFLGQATGAGNRDLLLAPAGLIACRDIEYAIGVDVEGHLDLWHASGSQRNALQAEAPQALVVACQLALALQHVNLHRRLVIFRRAEDLGLAHRNGRVALDQFGHHASQGLDPQRERGDIEQEHILHFTLEHACLDGRADSHYLVRVDALVRLFVEELAHQIDHRRHARLSTHQHYLLHVGCLDSRIRQRLHDRATRALMRSPTNCSSLARESVITRCLGPLASAVMKGRLISVCSDEESSILARSAASFKRCNAIRSLRRSMPCSLRNSSASQSMIRWSKSSPPRCVSPLVALTSMTPSPNCKMEISKVPPPRS